MRSAAAASSAAPADVPPPRPTRRRSPPTLERAASSNSNRAECRAGLTAAPRRATERSAAMDAPRRSEKEPHAWQTADAAPRQRRRRRTLGRSPAAQRARRRGQRAGYAGQPAMRHAIRAVRCCGRFCGARLANRHRHHRDDADRRRTSGPPLPLPNRAERDAEDVEAARRATEQRATGTSPRPSGESAPCVPGG